MTTRTGKRSLWREPLAYLSAAVICSVIWTGVGEVLDPKVSWQEHAVTGALFGVVMVLAAGCQDWGRQRRSQR